MPIRRSLSFFLVSSFLLVACDSPDNSLPSIDKTDELVVIVVDNSYVSQKSPESSHAGLEFDLVSEFSRELGMKLKFITTSELDEALLILEKNQGHLVVGINTIDKKISRVLFGPVYQRSRIQVVYNKNGIKPKNIQDLSGKNIWVMNGTINPEWLHEIELKIPDLKWGEMNVTSEDLFTKLTEGEVNYAVIDSSQMDSIGNLYPDVGVALDLNKENEKAWALSLDAEPNLAKEVHKFFKRIERDGTLERLLDKYYGRTYNLKKSDIDDILEKRRNLLPSLRHYFYLAEEITKIDWRLIAALAYQESRWDRLATSSTNVRGIMMLTEDTADRMDVTDRLDARQSILAGARYLLILKSMLPLRITEPDRTWIALAAYNQGYGHIEDARILAQQLKLNSDSWVSLKKILPLLDDSKYYENLKHGYARGGEAVSLTESVRIYYDILLRYERSYLQNSTIQRSAMPNQP